MNVATVGSEIAKYVGANERKVVKLMAEQSGLNESTIVPTALLVEDLWMDSLDHIEVVMAIEEYFNVEIPDQDCDGIKTVQEVFDLVNKHVPNVNKLSGTPKGRKPGAKRTVSARTRR